MVGDPATSQGILNNKFFKLIINKSKCYIHKTLELKCILHNSLFRMEELDPERHVGQNINLYVVWNEKTNFMMRAAEYNFFNSNYFLWLDIGAVRHNVCSSNIFLLL